MAEMKTRNIEIHLKTIFVIQASPPSLATISLYKPHHQRPPKDFLDHPEVLVCAFHVTR